MITATQGISLLPARFGGSAKQVRPKTEINTVWTGTSGQNSVKVIQSQAELDALWEKAFRNVGHYNYEPYQFVPTPKPQIDFDKQAVFYVKVRVPQSGYNVKLDAAEVQDNQWTLKMRIVDESFVSLCAFSTAAYLGVFDKPVGSTGTPQARLVLGE